MKDLHTRVSYSTDGVEIELLTVEAKKLTSKERNNLPDSDFAYIEPGGKKVDGKTEPRSLRKFPIQDAAHVRSALSYLGKSDLSPEAKKSALKKIKIAAKKFGVTVSDSDAKTKKEWDKINKKELKRDTQKEKEEHEKDAVKDDADRIRKLKEGKPSEKKSAEIRDLKKDVKFDKKSERKYAKAETDKERQERLERREGDQDKRELDRESLKERLKHHEDAVKNLKKEIAQLEKDKKEDEEDVKSESKAVSDKQKAAREKFMEMIRKKKKKGGDKDDEKDDKEKGDKKNNDKKEKSKARVIKNGEYEGKVPYQGPEPNPAVQYMPVARYNKQGEYVPYEGKEPDPAVQYVPEDEVGKHQSFMSECMANPTTHVNTAGLDENKANWACALAYDNLHKTSHARCGPFGCHY